MREPARLGRVEDNNHLCNHFFDKVEEWLLSHSTLCLFVLLAILTALFVMVCWAICGVSATDSGLQYNQFNNII